MVIQFIILIQKSDKINPLFIFLEEATLIFWPLEIYRIPSWLYCGIEEMRVRKFTGSSSKLTGRPRKFPQASSKLSKGSGKFAGTLS
jgi:hypothetical protein